MGKFVVKQRYTGEYFIELKAQNGMTILSSYNDYETVASCENAIESIKINSENINQFKRIESSQGSNYFLLKAKNGKVIGQSEYYYSQAAMENGISSVMKNAPYSETII